MGRLTRNLGHGKQSRIQSVTSAPTTLDGSDGDMQIYNGKLYIKDANVWHEYAPVSSQKSTPVSSGVLVSESGNVSSGGSYDSGVMTVPANSVITDLGCVAKTACTAGTTGVWGVRFGTTEGAEDIVAHNNNALKHPASTSLAAGVGTSMDPILQAALGGYEVILMDAGDAYSATEKDVHGDATCGGNISAGNIMFWVKYITIVPTKVSNLGFAFE